MDIHNEDVIEFPIDGILDLYIFNADSLSDLKHFRVKQAKNKVS